MVTRKLFTPELAMRALPLVRRMAEDLRAAAEALRDERQRPPPGGQDSEAAQNFERRLAEVLGEFDALGVEVKDPFAGLVDFRARRGRREVYLCWRLGEERVAHWHELDAGFPGRQPIETF